MKTKELIETIWAAERMASVWFFFLCMITLLCMVVWHDYRKESKGRR